VITREKKVPLHQNSRILSGSSKSSQQYLKSMLSPERREDSFRCVFSTRHDGWSLDTLYRRTLNMAPCVLLLRSLQQNIVLGAYISGEILCLSSCRN
jgi:hypothetical protein